MQNNYLLESIDYILLKEMIESIIQDTHFTNASRSSYDLEEKDLGDALEDLDTYHLLSNLKVVIIKNVFSNIDEKKMEHLFQYIENFNPNNLLILTTKKLDHRQNSVKKIKKLQNLTIKKLQLDSFSYIKNKCSKYHIDPETIHLLANRCQNDFSKIENECNKLMLYKIDTLEITKEDIESLVIKKLGDSSELLFSFMKYLLTKDKKKALESYQELASYQIDSTSIIGLITSQLRLIYQVKILSEQKLNHQQITETLLLKSTYQVKKMSEYSFYYTDKELRDLIHSVANLDFDIKSGKVDSLVALDLFILNLS